MDDFASQFQETQRTAVAISQLVIVFLILGILVAIGAAVWLFLDARERGKSGLAAALMALCSVFYGIPGTVIVVCAWILIRPDRTRRSTASTDDRLPDRLPSGIVAAPTSKEFLEGLEDNA